MRCSDGDLSSVSKRDAPLWPQRERQEEAGLSGSACSPMALEDEPPGASPFPRDAPLAFLLSGDGQTRVCSFLLERGQLTAWTWTQRGGRQCLVVLTLGGEG